MRWRGFPLSRRKRSSHRFPQLRLQTPQGLGLLVQQALLHKQRAGHFLKRGILMREARLQIVDAGDEFCDGFSHDHATSCIGNRTNAHSGCSIAKHHHIVLQPHGRVAGRAHRTVQLGDAIFQLEAMQFQ